MSPFITAMYAVDLKTSLSKYLRPLGYTFVPQLVRTKVFHDPTPPPRLYPTSCLDGLRGIAALCVFDFHYLFIFASQIGMPWGDSTHRWLIELPIVRLPYLGLPMVNIFFIVAGYVIALKPLQLMHKNTAASRQKLLQTLCSSVFRRVFRLYLPVVASTLIGVLAVRLGFWELLRAPLTMKAFFPGHREQQLPRLDTLGEQLTLWLQEMTHLLSVWNWRPFYAQHDPHLWTIPYEFRSSLVLYLALFFVARTRIYVRLFWLFFLSLLCYYSDRWEVVLYLWGACLAQWDIIRESKVVNETPALVDLEKTLDGVPVSADAPGLLSYRTANFNSVKIRRRAKDATYAAFFVLALWLLSSPTVGFATAYGYETFSYIVPSFWSRKEKFLPSLGAALLLWLLSRSSPKSIGHRLLTSHFVQYLGRISFSLYLMHGLLLHLYGYMVPIWVWNVVDRNSMLGWCVGIFVGWAANLTVALWAADIFCREIDMRCVQVSKWIEDRCFAKED